VTLQRQYQPGTADVNALIEALYALLTEFPDCQSPASDSLKIDLLSTSERVRNVF
jgi:hypothetical protein